eukprot:GHVR01102107.1.p1 GENE.GHVR01102107.1~~GHVR01102107.1.p1  ORF type:complete len:250 (+),score=36.70 GHVR01102107.1:21-770(+)
MMLILLVFLLTTICPPLIQGVVNNVIVPPYPDSPNDLDGNPCGKGYSIPKDTMSHYINCMQHQIHITPNLGTSQCLCINKMEIDEKKCAVLTSIQRDWLCGDLKPYCGDHDKIPPEFHLPNDDVDMNPFERDTDDNNSSLVAQEAKTIYVAMTAILRLYAFAHNEYCGLKIVTPEVDFIPDTSNYEKWTLGQKIYLKGKNSKPFLFAVMVQKQITTMIVIRGEQTYLDTYVSTSRDLTWVSELESYVSV